MHRAPLLAALVRYRPFDDDDARARERMRAFVEANPRCFERSLLSGHVTGSAWVLDRDRSHVLLTYHRKLGLWVQLGGHADGDPDVRRVAEREAREESGLTGLALVHEGIFDVDVHAIPARPGEPQHEHYDVRFLFEGDRGQPLLVAVAESKGLAWVPLEEVRRFTHDSSVVRMARKTKEEAR